MNLRVLSFRVDGSTSFLCCGIIPLCHFWTDSLENKQKNKQMEQKWQGATVKHFWQPQFNSKESMKPIWESALFTLETVHQHVCEEYCLLMKDTGLFCGTQQSLINSFDWHTRTPLHVIKQKIQAFLCKGFCVCVCVCADGTLSPISPQYCPLLPCKDTEKLHYFWTIRKQTDIFSKVPEWFINSCLMANKGTSYWFCDWTCITAYWTLTVVHFCYFYYARFSFLLTKEVG